MAAAKNKFFKVQTPRSEYYEIEAFFKESGILVASDDMTLEV